MMAAFSVRQKVMFHHCDPAGIVFYPRYFEMINTAMELWFDDRLKVPFDQLHGERNGAVPTVSIDAEFLKVSCHGDFLDFTVTPRKLGRSSLKVSVDVDCNAQERMKMQARLVYLNQKSGKSEPWPEDLHQAVSDDLSQVVMIHA